MTELSKYEKLLLDIITDHKDGLSEYELLELLKDKDNNESASNKDSRDIYKNNLTLFKAHFILFHSLYSLQKILLNNQEGCLEVDPLRIIIKAYLKTGQESLTKTDPLRDYYLDISNLETTTEEDVESLLTSFWEKYLTNDHRQEALEALGLEDPTDNETIRKRYKLLAMEHHPDRGGDKDKIQAINAAMERLKQ